MVATPHVRATPLVIFLACHGPCCALFADDSGCSCIYRSLCSRCCSAGGWRAGCIGSLGCSRRSRRRRCCNPWSPPRRHKHRCKRSDLANVDVPKVDVSTSTAEPKYATIDLALELCRGSGHISSAILLATDEDDLSFAGSSEGPAATLLAATCHALCASDAGCNNTTLSHVKCSSPDVTTSACRS